MYNEGDIYVTYRKAQSNYFNHGYRLPKEWNYHWKNKLNKTAQDNLTTITGYFNTKWTNINIEKYMEAGFEVIKSFSYKNFFDKRILKKYIAKDKQDKREIETTKRGIINSAKHAKFVISDDSIGTVLRKYCILRNGNTRQIIEDYLHNKIDAPFIVFLMKFGYLELTDVELSLIPYINQNKRQIFVELENIHEFLNKLLER